MVSIQELGDKSLLMHRFRISIHCKHESLKIFDQVLRKSESFEAETCVRADIILHNFA